MTDVLLTAILIVLVLQLGTSNRWGGRLRTIAQDVFFFIRDRIRERRS